MASSKSTLVIGSCVLIAALVATLASKQAAKLRAENEALRARVAEYETSPSEPTVSNEPSAPELNKQDAAELLRLRGEVTQLRRRQSELEKLKEENAALRGRLLAAADSANRADERAQEEDGAKQVGIAKLNYTRVWLQAFRNFAEQNQGRMPANFDLARAYLPQGFNSEMDPNQFEIVFSGLLQQIQDAGKEAQNIIVLREREAYVGLDGVRSKAYAFADGHSEIRREPTEGFEQWERARMLPGE